MKNLKRFTTKSDYAEAELFYPNVSIISGDSTPIFEPDAPSSSGQVPQYEVVDQVPQEANYDDAFVKANMKWYKRNNLNEYEEYGVYALTNDLDSITHYDGKLAVVGTTEYEWSSVSGWAEVGVYEDEQHVIEVSEETAHELRGTELPTTFKIPKSDIEGWLDMNIRCEGGGELRISADRYEYGWEIQGTVYDDGEYLNYSLPLEAPQSVIIEDVMLMGMGTYHIMYGTKNITVEYVERDEPYGAKSYPMISVADGDTDVYYGLPAYIDGDVYIYSKNNAWRKVEGTSLNYFKLVPTSGNAKFNLSASAPFYVSYDDGLSWSYTTNMMKVAEGAHVLLKATNLPIEWQKGIGAISSDGYFNAEGNIMSLVYGDNFSGQTSLVEKDGVFFNLFSKCTTLLSAENLLLPATTLAPYCYDSMFADCTSLTTAPTIPATTLANAYGCYNNMFQGCTSLTTAPSLPATTLASDCYSHMFWGCTNLTTAPTTLPATTLDYGCYVGMFSFCTSLTTAPELPAMTLTERCYLQMFSNCTSLTTAPTLPATTLASECYRYMFNGCSSLSSITCLATGFVYKSTEPWVTGVAASGTFTTPSSTDWLSGDNGIPNGWTRIDA